MSRRTTIGTKWAVRHIPTGHFLPVATGRQGRGGSHVEPCDPKDAPPRLCDSEKSAIAVLSQWLRGKATIRYIWEYDEFRGKDYKVEDGVEIEPVPTRIKDDMEIVQVELVVIDE